MLAGLIIKYCGSIWKQIDELRMNSEKAKLLKDIPNYGGVYKITTNGDIYKGNQKLSPVNNGLGYYKIKLRNGYEINHINHDKSNNSLANLELVTHSLNLKKAVEKHGHFGFLK